MGDRRPAFTGLRRRGVSAGRFTSRNLMVGDTGIEPVTFPVSGGRSPAELIARPEEASIPRPLPLQVSQSTCVPWRMKGPVDAM